MTGDMSRQAKDFSFICEHCGATVERVPTLDGSKLVKKWPRNACPACHWSKHVEFGGGEYGYPPCGAMMRPHLIGDGTVTWRCTGCGFMMTGPSEKMTDEVAAGQRPQGMKYKLYRKE